MSAAAALLRRHPLLGAIFITILLHVCGTVLIEGYSSPFSIRANSSKLRLMR